MTLRNIGLIASGMLAVCMYATAADEQLNGYLCCNVYTDGQEISDINFGGLGQHLIPVGSPIRVTKWKKNRFAVVVDNKNFRFDNDYSRELPITAFAKRYIVAEDPTLKIKTFPKDIQAAIVEGRLVRGMTREQILMSLGYPTGDEVPNLNSKSWTYWYTDKVQYRIKFDEQDRLIDVENVIDVRQRLLEERHE